MYHILTQSFATLFHFELVIKIKVDKVRCASKGRIYYIDASFIYVNGCFDKYKRVFLWIFKESLNKKSKKVWYLSHFFFNFEGFANLYLNSPGRTILTVRWLILPDVSPGEEPHRQGWLPHPGAPHHSHPQPGQSVRQTRPETSPDMITIDMIRNQTTLDTLHNISICG